jgi:hypothetical protein
MREVPKSTTGVSPHVLCFGKLPRGPLAILKESWTGEQDLPVTCNTSVENYLAELKQNLVDAGKYADEHAKREQRRYVSHYNLRSRDKHFVAGESVSVYCLIRHRAKSSASGEARLRLLKLRHLIAVSLN